MTVQDRVRNFITNDLRWDGDPAELTDDLPLISSGVVDSVGIYELVTFLETELGVAVPDEEVLPANFGSLDAIATFVSSQS